MTNVSPAIGLTSPFNSYGAMSAIILWLIRSRPHDGGFQGDGPSLTGVGEENLLHQVLPLMATSPSQQSAKSMRPSRRALTHPRHKTPTFARKISKNTSPLGRTTRNGEVFKKKQAHANWHTFGDELYEVNNPSLFISRGP